MTSGQNANLMKTEDDSILSLLVGSMIIGTAIHALVHSEFSLKK